MCGTNKPDYIILNYWDIVWSWSSCKSTAFLFWLRTKYNRHGIGDAFILHFDVEIVYYNLQGELKSYCCNNIVYRQPTDE